MRLYFLRHGKAVDRDSWQGSDDERPLKRQGCKDVDLLGEHFRRKGFKLDLVVTSPLTRAVQTAEIFSKSLRMLSGFQIDDRLRPGCTLELLRSLVLGYPHADRLLVIGHEPDFSTLIGDLTGGYTLVLRKGALARVDLADSGFSGTLVWLIQPALIR